jgi:hypothetical protein
MDFPRLVELLVSERDLDLPLLDLLHATWPGWNPSEERWRGLAERLNRVALAQQGATRERAID